MEVAADLGWKGSKNSSGRRREAFQSVKRHLQECGGSSGNDKRVWLYRGRGTKRAWRGMAQLQWQEAGGGLGMAPGNSQGTARSQRTLYTQVKVRFACYKDSFCRGARSRVKPGQRAPESGRPQCRPEIVRSELVNTIMTAFCHIV